MAYMNLLHYHSVQLPPMNCKIVLDQEKSYTAGDLVHGKLNINLSKELFSFGLRIALEGTAMVKVRDQQGTQTKTEALGTSFTYVHGKGDVRIRLAPGDYEFPFALRLFGQGPGGLPGSFRTPFGLVIYQLVAYVQLEWKFVRKAEKTIQVSSYFNLAIQDPHVLQPLVVEKAEKSLLPSLMSRSSSKFRYILRLPHSGFICGDIMSFELELENPSSYEVSLKQLTFLQKISYNAGNCCKTKQKILHRLQSPRMEAIWTDTMQIPHGLPSTQKGIIEIQYLLRVEVKCQGQCSLRGDIPIAIGTTREEIAPEPQLLSPDPPPKQRERSPSPCPLFRSRSACTRPTTTAHQHRKGLDRADSAASSTPSSAGSRPPRYSQLSIHKAKSTSTETMPPSYEDSVSKAPKSPEVESQEILEFKTKEEEDAEEELDEEEDPPTPSTPTIPLRALSLDTTPEEH